MFFVTTKTISIEIGQEYGDNSHSHYFTRITIKN
jgi:hypothetical protein